jgi:predicted metal-binding protein
MQISNIIYKNVFVYRTPKYIINVNYISKYVPVDEVFIEIDRFDNSCKTGCSNYKNCYVCPPFSPKFDKISKGYKYLYTYIIYSYMRDFPFHTPKWRNPWWKYINANRSLSHLVRKIGFVAEKMLQGILLKDGDCRYCRPCKVILKQPCTHPDKKRYSLESTGVNCDQLALRLGHKILWYRNLIVPEYITLMGGVLTNKILDPDIIFRGGLRAI